MDAAKLKITEEEKKITYEWEDNKLIINGMKESFTVLYTNSENVEYYTQCKFAWIPDVTSENIKLYLNREGFTVQDHNFMAVLNMAYRSPVMRRSLNLYLSNDYEDAIRNNLTQMCITQYNKIENLEKEALQLREYMNSHPEPSDEKDIINIPLQLHVMRDVGFNSEGFETYSLWQPITKGITYYNDNEERYKDDDKVRLYKDDNTLFSKIECDGFNPNILSKEYAGEKFLEILNKYQNGIGCEILFIEIPHMKYIENNNVSYIIKLVVADTGRFKIFKKIHDSIDEVLRTKFIGLNSRNFISYEYED